MARQPVALKVEHVSMKFNLSSEKVDNIKEYLIKMIKKELMFQEFWALRDINFEVRRGDRLGIMGLNGAGKSTLLKIVSGVLKATEGNVSIHGKIAPLLELGAGFDRQYTGGEKLFIRDACEAGICRGDCGRAGYTDPGRSAERRGCQVQKEM